MRLPRLPVRVSLGDTGRLAVDALQGLFARTPSQARSTGMTTVATSPVRAVIPGEDELGVQKRCPRCREWWPADHEFYKPRYGGRQQGQLHSWCIACVYEQRPMRPSTIARGTRR